MTQEQADKEYKETLNDIEKLLRKLHTMSYRLTDGAVYYNQLETVYRRGSEIFEMISDAEETFLQFQDDLPKLQAPKYND
jgi:hypothetical protein